MASLNIEGVPERMQEELARAAEQNGRSLSSEVLARLGSTFPTQDRAHWAGETKEERAKRIFEMRDEIRRQYPHSESGMTLEEIVRQVRWDRDFGHKCNY